MERGQRPLAKEGGLYLAVQESPEFLLTPLLMEPVCLLSQGRCAEPVRPCKFNHHQNHHHHHHHHHHWWIREL